ncbi:SIR2 family protein [Bradyrhizobium sp. MOS002]|uniref:SIR2 family NAD-dependent protein deacylase n=1 Tax=Bradyrhizobium sp. MOS002 TaxID=2133947 RepID=UPI001304E09B|nr:SIR2 family protein [Bradyrhizobium sp. MOS002]
MWQRLDRRRLGLILGAGVSIDAGLPTWKNLVERLTARFPAVKKEFKAHRKAGLQETYITQIAYALHQAHVKGSTSTLPRQFEQYQVDSTWMEVVHQELYRDIASLKYDQILQRHSYLKSLGQLVCRTELTVNFNFDDLVDEAAIGFARDRSKVQPEVISRPKIETRRDASVIYHINGSLPREARRRRSENLVFTEDAFADVLISPTLHGSDFLMSRFATTTFLLLGTSLNDNSLKNMLRAGMKRNPANHHYIVYWEDPARRRTDEERRHIFDVNLDVYNLISIFLETEQIAELVDLLNEEEAGLFEAELMKFSHHPARRKYYLVGSVVAGKSSNLEGLRCFSTFEEWSGRAPETMYQDHRSLSVAQRKEIDDWLYSQLREKNDKMRRAGVGMHVMDRCYLDLCAFSKTDAENVERLKELRARVCKHSGPLEAGQMIFLEADESALSDRQARRGKLRGVTMVIDYDGAALVKQSAVLKSVYMPEPAFTFDNSLEGSDQTSRRIARQILLGEYKPFDFEKRIDELLASGGKV